MSNTKNNDGLLASLMKQKGGSDSYSWHRQESPGPEFKKGRKTNARNNLLTEKQHPWETSKKSGEEKREQWIMEVRNVMAETGLNWRDALKEASRIRRESNPEYQTVKQRVVESYTGRDADTVACPTGVCPGKYNKAISVNKDGEKIYRPQGHNGRKELLSTAAATEILREYYKERAYKYKKGSKKALNADISRKNHSRKIQTSCPTKVINVNRNGKVYQRRIIDRDHPDFQNCRSNWLYRSNPRKFDIDRIDDGSDEAIANRTSKK